MPDAGVVGAVHAAAEEATAGLPVPPICRHWARRGACLFAEKCKFRHESAESAAAADDKEGDAIPQKGRFARRHRARNRNKAGDFRRWLVQTFTYEVLCSGGGVCDVAGGKAGAYTRSLQSST